MVSDDRRPHPPTERRLARLWAEGVSPASPALVGAAVLVVMMTLTRIFAPIGLSWCLRIARDGLDAAATPATASVVARQSALQGAMAISLITVVPLLVCLLAQTVQRRKASNEASVRTPGGGTQTPHQCSFDGLRLTRGILMVALVAAGVAAVIRGTLNAAPVLVHADSLFQAGGELLQAVGWPLLLMMVGVALLDALLGRIAWRRTAWMSRRELEEELRETEGHPSYRERRAKKRRGR